MAPYSAFLAACRSNDSAAASKLLSGVPKDKSVLIDRQGKNGTTALMDAVFLGNEEIVALLLANGASLDIKNKDGNTALHLAYTKHLPKIIAMLIKSGADPEARNAAGLQPKKLLSAHAHKLFEPRRPDNSLSDHRGLDTTIESLCVSVLQSDAFTLALKSRSIDDACEIIKKAAAGAEVAVNDFVNAADAKGSTPLMHCVSYFYFTLRIFASLIASFIRRGMEWFPIRQFFSKWALIQTCPTSR